MVPFHVNKVYFAGEQTEGHGERRTDKKLWSNCERQEDVVDVVNADDEDEIIWVVLNVIIVNKLPKLSFFKEKTTFPNYHFDTYSSNIIDFPTAESHQHIITCSSSQN